MIFKNQMPGISQLQEPVKLGKIESWMVDFVKGRHSQEEWGSFFVYCKAGPIKRAFIYAGWLFSTLLLGNR